MVNILVCCAITVWPVIVRAQGLRRMASAVYESLHFDSIDRQSGLSHPSVTAILRDKRGFMWIGTQSGLNRYDGDVVRVFRRSRYDKHSLPNDHITVLEPASARSLWVGTLGGGVARLDLETDAFHRVPFKGGAQRTGSGIIIDLATTPDGTLWVATEGGLGVLRRGAHAIVPLTPAGVRVRQLVITARGAVLALTTNAVQRYSSFGSRPQTINISGTGAANLQFLERKGAGRYWALAGKQLFDARLEGRTLTLTPVARSSIANPRAMQTDAWGNVWIGGIDGLEVYVPARHAFATPAVYLKGSRRSVRSLYMHGADVWVGTNLGGVKYANLDDQVAATIPTPDGVPVVTEYTLPGGDILLGTHPGLYLFNPKTRHYRSLLPGNIKAPSVVSFLARGSRIWFSSTDGLGWIDARTLQVHLTMHQRFAYPLLIAARSDGRLLMSTGAELVNVDPDGKHIVSSKPMSRTLARLDLGRARVLIGGFYGAYVYDLSCSCTTNLLKNYPESPPIVTALYKGGGDYYWLGTHDQGVVEMRWDGKHEPARDDFRIFDRTRGLAANAIGGIEGDKHGNLWLSTTAGFSRFDPASQTFTNYFADAGAASRGYIIGASARTPGDMIVFGSLHNVTLIPDVKRQVASPPAPVITDIKLANRSLASHHLDARSPLQWLPPYAEHLVLPYGSPALSLDFSTLTYPEPNGMGYWYRLIPLERNWTAIARGRRSATYTSLSPGHYEFQVANDPSHRQVRTFSVDITPPWYLKTWVIALAILLALILVWLGIRLRLMSIKARAERLAVLVEARTAELQHTNEELKVALEHVKTLRGIVPICASCKKIRDDDGYWQQLEVYMREHTEAEFSHGICDECMNKLYSEQVPP